MSQKSSTFAADLGASNEPVTICDLKIDKKATKKRQKSDKKATKFLLSIHYKDPSHSLARNNTIIIIASSRPAKEICSKYNLALGYDEHFGGELAHIVVMQHVTKSKIDGFIKEIQ